MLRTGAWRRPRHGGSTFRLSWRCIRPRGRPTLRELALAALILMIATTNVFNRLNVTTMQVAGAWA